MYCVGSEQNSRNGILFGIVTFFFVFLILVWDEENLHNCSAYILSPLLYNIHFGRKGGCAPTEVNRKSYCQKSFGTLQQQGLQGALRSDAKNSQEKVFCDGIFVVLPEHFWCSLKSECMLVLPMPFPATRGQCMWFVQGH